MGAPLIKDGRLVGALCVTASRPRAWTESEVELLREAGERVWSAIERARAEAVLRESEARFAQFAASSSDALWIRDADTLAMEYTSPAIQAIYGIAPDAILGAVERWSALVLPDDRTTALAHLEQARAGEAVVHEFRIRRSADGAVRRIRNTDFPLRDAGGRVQRIGGIAEDVTELKETVAALAAAETRQRALVEGIPQLVWRAVEGGAWTWASPQWSAYTGQAEADSRGFGWLEPIHPDDRASIETAWSRAEATGAFEAEYRLRHAAERRHRWFQTRATPVRDEVGRIVEWLGTSTDVDDLRRMRERQEVMVAELQHRTRNLIAVVRSIAGQTLDASEGLDAFRDTFDDRLAALSRVQGLLSRSDRERITIGGLLRFELDALGAGEVMERVGLSGPDVPLRNSVVQTLALALHELATNARKYGALATDAGRLDVTWDVRLDARERRRLALTWTETGVGARREKECFVTGTSGYGRELIEQALPHALGARTTYELAAGGVRCTIDLPLDKRRSRAA